MTTVAQNGAGTVWSAAMVDDLKTLLREGQSFGKIAKILSAKYRPITRSAAIGKATRLKLAGRSANGGAYRRKPTHRVATQSRRQSSKTAQSSPWRAPKKSVLQKILEKGPADLVPEPAIAPPAERQSILRRNKNGDIEANPKLTEKCCRWPLGDPRTADFHFCCKEKVPGSPYCPAHTLRAFVPFEPKRRKRSQSVQASNQRERHEPGTPAVS